MASAAIKNETLRRSLVRVITRPSSDRVNGWRSVWSAALSAHPLANERRAVGQHDTGPFNLGEKSHHFDIEERDLVEIQLCPSAAFELTANGVEVLRTHASKQADRCDISADLFLDLEHRPPDLAGPLDATLRSVTTSS